MVTVDFVDFERCAIVSILLLDTRTVVLIERGVRESEARNFCVVEEETKDFSN